MKIYLKQNVFQAALDRINYLFDEFPKVVIGFSGGKDSTVVLNLALKVASERGRLPLTVLFIDQEAEWQATVDYVRTVMDHPAVNPMWMQMPLRISNATSAEQPWLYCWADGKDDEWLRPKEPDAWRVNKYGTLTFADLFTKIPEVEWPDTPMCYLSGVRCEESMSRFIGLTSQATYKHITYGKYLNRKLGHYTFYPIYDWTYTDVWKAIHDNGWDYCRLYDYMFQYGVPIRNMRVSNVHHETAIRSLYYMQEFEPLTWNRLTQRLSGIKMSGQLKREAYEVVRELPPVFSSWREYRDYLLANLTQDEKVRGILRKQFDRMDIAYDTYPDQTDMMKVQIGAILANDYHNVKIGNWERSPVRHLYRKKKADPNYKVWSGAYAEAIKP